MPPVSFIETYQPILGVVAFVGGWGLAMLTGLMFKAAS
jgi:hypothetical protein